MPKGPRGAKRPADIGLAVMVGRIATGEIFYRSRAPGGPGRVAATRQSRAIWRHSTLASSSMVASPR